MKLKIRLILLASLALAVGCTKPDDPNPEPRTPDEVPIDALFSVDDGKQVKFAHGNLIYNAGSGLTFASEQYHYGDLFGWGTGSQPDLTSVNLNAYQTFDEWGDHIGNSWRTMTCDEWEYLISKRPDASSKIGHATVCNIHGIILLPDNWQGTGFTPGTANGWATNIYSATSWAAMEAAGAVFLPAAGHRYETETENTGNEGDYWSSTPTKLTYAYSLNFGENFHGMSDCWLKCSGLAVRLVKDNADN